MSDRKPSMSLEELLLLNEVISSTLGIHFPERRKEILEFRLRPRLKELHLQRFMDYYLLLTYDLEGELRHLARLVTNNESYFFRETKQFEDLLGEALPELIAERRAASGLRVLCAGCSSGEEPYTLSIFARSLRPLRSGLRLQIDAFDVDADRVEAARRAVYGRTSLRALTESQIQRYFLAAEGGTHELRPVYREEVRFFTGNIVDYATFPRHFAYDVVFCRNVLIYFSERAIDRAAESLARALRPGGLLFLGHAESLIGVTEQFEPERLPSSIAYRRVGP